MKIRIMAMLLAVVMLLTLLPGCGAAEAEPAATTMAATEAPTTEATTEPTTEPTTVPTEPLVYVETEGYELWDGVKRLNWIHNRASGSFRATLFPSLQS